MTLTCQKSASARPGKIVLTGGPGAGKTAILELARRILCPQVVIIPEAASIVFGGGFWRHESLPARKAAQRAIYFIQSELEHIVDQEGAVTFALCDRGTVDGGAYWPGETSDYFTELQTTLAQELQRYQAVIHLQTPSQTQGYNKQNPLRIENPSEAAAIDQRIQDIWASHPNRIIIKSEENFLVKADLALQAIFQFLPPCCRQRQKTLA